MKKLVRTNLTNTPSKRGTENLNIQFYSHDKNNAGFEFVIKNETDLTQYTPKVLFKFRDSNSTWQANGTIEGNIVKVNFNTDLIARCEEVLGFLFLDSDSDSLDIFKFKFNVVLSEIDKGEVANRQIKHVNNIGELELVTRSQLKEELSKLQINGVDLTNYLTTTVAEETYATKQELRSYALNKDVPSIINGLVTEEQLKTANNGVLEEVKKLGYAKTTEVPAAYNDSALVERVAALENRPSTSGGNVDEDIKNRVTELESKFVGVNGETIDLKNLVTDEKLNYEFINRNTSAAIIQADKDIETYFLENTDRKDVDKIQVRGYVYSNNSETKIFKQKNGDDLEFVYFQGAMITLANVLPKDYDNYTFNDPEKRVTLLTDKNFKEMVATPEFKAVVKESLREIVKEILREEN